MIFRTAVRDGETIDQASIRAAAIAGEKKYSGYEIVCEKCGQPVYAHQHATDCETWIKEFGIIPFER